MKGLSNREAFCVVGDRGTLEAQNRAAVDWEHLAFVPDLLGLFRGQSEKLKAIDFSEISADPGGCLAAGNRSYFSRITHPQRDAEHSRQSTFADFECNSGYKRTVGGENRNWCAISVSRMPPSVRNALRGLLASAIIIHGWSSPLLNRIGTNSILLK